MSVIRLRSNRRGRPPPVSTRVSLTATRPERQYSSATERVSIGDAAIDRAVGNGTSKRCGIERLIG